MKLLQLKSSRLLLLAAVPTLVFPLSATAGETLEAKAPVEEAVAPPEEKEWWIKPTVDLRARYEYADQDGRSTAHAETLRARLGLLTKEIYGFQLFAEYEGTLAADRDSYQAASVHGLGQNKSIIADPESHELNQLWGSYNYNGLFKIKAGRQAINLDGQRYVGGVAWRQNMQTFDAAALTLSPVDDFDFYYSYVNRVERIFGSGDIRNPGQTDFEGNSHLINAAYSGWSFGKLVAYAYLLDLNNDAGDVNSNNSFGLSLSGKLGEALALNYYLEYGFQTDAFDSPLDYQTHYFHGNLKRTFDKITLGLGYEYLGSDNGVGYKFPLGTNHKFNGFADVFLATPAAGLQDIYATVAAKLPFGFGASAAYHRFYSASGGDEYGDEIDFVLTKTLGKGFSFLFKYAYYFENGFAVDTNRFSAEINYKF